MTDLSLDALRVFLVVLRAGSISGAAPVLGLSPPTVSAQLGALERRLGYPLFDRGPRGMRPTDRAVELAGRVEGPLGELAQLELSDRDPIGRRTVHLAGPAEFLSTVVVPRLVEELPDVVRVRVKFGLADSLLDDLVAGGVDLLVSSVQPRRPGVSMVPLFDEEFVLVAAPRWSDAIQGEIVPGDDAIAELSEVPALVYAADLPIVRRYWRTVFDRRPTGLDVRMVVPDLRLIADLVAGGAGMSVLPRYLVQSRLEDGELVELFRPAVTPLNTVYLARRSIGAAPGTDEVHDLVIRLARTVSA